MSCRLPLSRGASRSPYCLNCCSTGAAATPTLRHTLMDDALCLLEPSKIRDLYADRGFIGHVWIQGLARRGISICVQVRLNTLVNGWSARDWLQDLKPGDTGLWAEEVNG